MPLPPVPPAWPFGTERAWRDFSDALTQTTAPEADFWRAEAARELARIARCRSAPAQPIRHAMIPERDEHPAGWPSRQTSSASGLKEVGSLPLFLTPRVHARAEHSCFLPRRCRRDGGGAADGDLDHRHGRSRYRPVRSPEARGASWAAGASKA